MQFDVGIVRVTQAVDSLTAALLTLSHAYELRVCSFALSDVDIAKLPLQTDAVYWDGHDFTRTTAEIPAICEARFNPLSSRMASNPALFEKLELLKKNTVFTEYSSLGKTAISLLLLQTPLYDLTIPTYYLANYEEFKKYAEMLKKSILKPSAGRKGRHVCKIDFCGAPPTLYCNGLTVRYSPDDWNAYCEDLDREQLGHPILQPRLDFCLDDAHAVDFRLLVCRGASGNWEKVAIYARIGSNNTVSNLSHGGYIADAEEILQIIAPDKSAQILRALEKYCITIPETIQQFQNTTVSCLGIDIGIDRTTQKPYILEANTMPGTKYHTWQLAEKKVQYYSYLINQPQTTTSL